MAREVKKVDDLFAELVLSADDKTKIVIKVKLLKELPKDQEFFFDPETYGPVLFSTISGEKNPKGNSFLETVKVVAQAEKRVDYVIIRYLWTSTGRFLSRGEKIISLFL